MPTSAGQSGSVTVKCWPSSCELDRLEYEAGIELIGRGQRTTALLVAIRQAGYHVGWATFWQLGRGQFVSMVSARDARTGEKFVVHARSEEQATVELARWLGG